MKHIQEYISLYRNRPFNLRLSTEQENELILEAQSGNIIAFEKVLLNKY